MTIYLLRNSTYHRELQFNELSKIWVFWTLEVLTGISSVLDQPGLFVSLQVVGIEPRALHMPANALPLI